MKMKKLLVNARITEVAAVSNRLILEFNKGDWSNDQYLTSVNSEMKNLTEMLTLTINSVKAESNLKEKDLARDSKIKGIYFLVNGYLQFDDNTLKEAAKKIDMVFEHYGVNLIRKSYATQSSLTESLLGDFVDENVQNSISVLPGLNKLISELRTAQTDFEESKLNYENEKAEKKNSKKATELKKELLELINNKLVVYLRAMVQVNEDKYGAFAGFVSQVIGDVNASVKKRSKKNKIDDNGN